MGGGGVIILEFIVDIFMDFWFSLVILVFIFWERFVDI